MPRDKTKCAHWTLKVKVTSVDQGSWPATHIDVGAQVASGNATLQNTTAVTRMVTQSSAQVKFQGRRQGTVTLTATVRGGKWRQVQAVQVNVPHEGVVEILIQRVMVYLKLVFLEPGGFGVERDFPRGFPVTVVFADGGTQMETTGPGGLLHFEVDPARTWFTLRFDSGARQHIAVAPAASPPPGDAVRMAADADLTGLHDARFRCFALPLQWNLETSDWAVAPCPHWDGAHHRFNIPANQDIGAGGGEIKLTLDPRWHYFRFEYFDRYYGETDHHARISVPPISLKGFRTNPDAPAPDTESNWTIGNANSLLQCLPWILRRQPGGAALPPLDSTMGLQFNTDPARRTFAYSQSAAARALRHLDPVADAPALAPGPDRLRYYDLPRVWKSGRYYARWTPASPPGVGGKFWQDLLPADIARAAARGTPLIFSLDDMVLTDQNRRQLALGPADRVAIFHHSFAAAAAPPLSNEGLYRPGAAISTDGYPYSDVVRSTRHYVDDYPDWTRLLTAQGNLFDVFDDRTPDIPGNDVVGARAAVRWVDATVGPSGAASHSALNPRPARTEQPFFSIQPFYEQKYLTRWNNPTPGPIFHDEWAAAYSPPGYQIGRFDIAHVRCAGRDGADEVSALIRYLRLTLDFSSSLGTTGNPYSPPVAALSPPPYDTIEWTRRLLSVVPARWNGHDASNADRTWILPRAPQPGAPPLRAQIVTIFQYLTPALAHFDVITGHHSITSSMNSTAGTGKLRVNAVDHDAGAPGNDAWGVQRTGRGLASAHEMGHCTSMPDEYRSNDKDSKHYKSLHLLGNPYILDLQALMKFNWFIRARYLWHAAEWLRTLGGLGAVEFKLEHGATEDDYHLPHYRHAGTQPGRSFVNWPVRFNLRSRAGGDRSLFDSVLYLLGRDEYSTTVLPGLLGGGGDVDGVLVVMLRIKMDVSTIGGNQAFRKKVRDRLISRLEQRFDAALNARRHAALRLLGSPPPPALQRCLLHFVPCFLTRVGGPGGGYAAGLEAASPAHLFVDVRPTFLADAFTDSNPPAMKTLDLQCAAGLSGLGNAALNNQIQGMTNRIFDRCLATMGLSEDADPTVAGSYMSPPSYGRIVRTVMDVAASPPVVR